MIRYNGRILYSTGVAFTSNCTECEAGTFSSIGASICEPCPPNTYSKRGAAKCIACDETIQYSGNVTRLSSHIL